MFISDLRIQMLPERGLKVLATSLNTHPKNKPFYFYCISREAHDATHG